MRARSASVTPTHPDVGLGLGVGDENDSVIPRRARRKRTVTVKARTSSSFVMPTIRDVLLAALLASVVFVPAGFWLATRISDSDSAAGYDDVDAEAEVDANTNEDAAAAAVESRDLLRGGKGGGREGRDTGAIIPLEARSSVGGAGRAPPPSSDRY